MWLKEEILDTPHKIADRLLELIHSAVQSIDIEVYIFDVDEFGMKVAEALIQARQRGVKVRLLVDGIGSFGFSTSLLPHLVENKISVRIYHPTPWDYNFTKLLWWVRWRTYLKLLGGINKRNHRKVFIFDHHQAVVGSMNISNTHLVPPGWRDTAVLVTGSSTKLLHLAFQRAWRFSRKIGEILARRQLKKFEVQDLYFNFTRRLRRLSHFKVTHDISHSRKRVWITTAYFIPHRRLLKSLQEAAARGVDVCVLVPQKSDVIFVKLIAAAFYLGLLKRGVKIFEYKPQILHAKILILDEKAMVGSSNLNHRSFLHDLEVDVILSKPESLAALAQRFKTDLEKSVPITEEWAQHRPFWEKWLAHVLLILRYWM